MLRERDEQEATGLIVKDQLTLQEFTDRWLQEKVAVRLAPSTQNNYSRTMRVHILPLFGGVKMREIRVDHANRLVGKLKSAGHAPKGINNILGVFITILNDAVEWQCLARNPLFRYRLMKEHELHYDYWTAPEIQQFLNATIFDPLQPIYITALNTGMRKGELCALKWDRVDFVRNQLIVSRSLSRYGLSETTKSGRKRYVPINGVVKHLLQKLLKNQRGEYVFSDKDGNPPDAHHLYRDFRNAQKRAGFTRLVRFHDLRHTFASHFMMNGGNIYDVQKILGHSSLEMTQRYAHMSPDHLAEAIKIVSFEAEQPENVVQISEAIKIV